MLPTEIDCGVCRLRPWRLTDRDALVRHANNRGVWRNLRDLFPHPYTPADADAWLAFAAAEPTPEWIYAVEIDGEAAGTVSLRRQNDVERRSAELGYWIGEVFWGRGIVPAAVRAVTGLAFERTDLCRVFAPVFAWNAASMRVLEKAGYRREAVLVRSAVKDGVLVDQVVHAVTRDPGLPYVAAP